jgi:hypothetical protein
MGALAWHASEWLKTTKGMAMKAKLLALALCGSFAATAQADGVGVYINGGTTGFGLGLAGAASENVTTRLSFDTWKRTVTKNDSNGNYNVDLKLQNVAALADWYPFSGAFRATFGLVANGNKATLTATPTGGFYTFNGNQYPSNYVDSFSGEMKFNSTAPYLGIGWGNPVAKDKTWGLVSDIGVLFQGSPKITSTVNCSSAAVSAGQCSALQSSVAAAAAQSETDLKNYKYWPVISIGVSYHF